jgi:hypothetical protein
MNENLVLNNFNYKADYKECIQFLNSIEKMKSYMQKGIEIRIKALESIVDDKYAKVIAKESKRFMIHGLRLLQHDLSIYGDLYAQRNPEDHRGEKTLEHVHNQTQKQQPQFSVLSLPG